MGHFRGTLQGGRGQASRLGTAKSGLSATLASWQGAVRVDLFVWEGVDHVRVVFTRHHGKGCGETIFEGPVSGDGAKAALYRAAAQCEPDPDRTPAEKTAIVKDIAKRLGVPAIDLPRGEG